MKKYIISSLLLIPIVVILILMANSTTPPRIKQIVILATIKRCIWYGCQGNIILSESDGEKEEIVLPESLTEYVPPTTLFGLEELNSCTEKCDLIYNPKGYEKKTWIIIYNAKDFNSRFGGNYVLWSNKEISRKRGIIKKIKKQKSSYKYYSTRK